MTAQASLARDIDAPLAGRVALVTGGAGGLGAATCQALAAAGAAIAVVDVRAAPAEELSVELNATGARAIAVAADLRSPVDIDAALRRTVLALGSLDILVNNAGIDVTASVDDLAVEDWERIVAINLSAPFLAARAAFPLMRARGWGRIVNVASTASRRAWPNASAYHATKWGLLGLSHALHAEGRPFGIGVTAVIAGGMRTPFLFDRFPDIDPGVLQDPAAVADAIRYAVTAPAGSVVPEIMVLPMGETSWP